MNTEKDTIKGRRQIKKKIFDRITGSSRMQNFDPV
jgi:hypothetical protein